MCRFVTKSAFGGLKLLFFNDLMLAGSLQKRGMGLQKITAKLQAALQQAQQTAFNSAHPELEESHVLLALLVQEGLSLIHI